MLLLYAETRLAPAIVQASGFELQQRLATGGAPIPAIFITAHDDPITRERAVGRGYLQKPFREDALIGAIQQALGGRGV
ncbi:MAG TPA: hypothetical protein VGT40_04915 [Methylomirabilota bacterium]|nr:hypothetical protein [Methylomirabilota bacterium]